MATIGHGFRSTAINKSKSSQILQKSHVLHVLCFIVGFSLGMASCSYLQSFSFTLQITDLISTSSQPQLSLKSLDEIDTTFNSTKNTYSSTIKDMAFNSTTSAYKSTVKDQFSLMHNMSDEQLLVKASSMNISWNNEDKNGAKKVAFLFLSKGTLPFAPLWEKFFQGQEGLYSIYVHPHPSHNDSWPPSSVFFGRRIPSKPVKWGQWNMIEAERRLLANALLDTSNERFVLLSESCIPLFGFKKTYDYLMNSNLSFLNSSDDPGEAGRGRYNPKMWPNVNITNWRKGSQWFELHRELAILIVSDERYPPVFEKHCRPPCYNMEEHYIQTIVNILHPQLSSNRSITWVDWSRGGPHPKEYQWRDITHEFLNRIRYGSECIYNGNVTSMCYLFARKFLPNALEPLLRVAPLLLGFDS